MVRTALTKWNEPALLERFRPDERQVVIRESAAGRVVLRPSPPESAPASGSASARLDVRDDLEARGMYDESGPNVYVVLDEGCNSTCHDQQWSNMPLKKFQNLGYTMPSTDQTTKSFTGLGTGDWATSGSRRIPFSLNFLSQGNPCHRFLKVMRSAKEKPRCCYHSTVS